MSYFIVLGDGVEVTLYFFWRWCVTSCLIFWEVGGSDVLLLFFSGVWNFFSSLFGFCMCVGILCWC